MEHLLFNNKDTLESKRLKMELICLKAFERSIAKQCNDDKQFSYVRLALKEDDLEVGLNIANHYKSVNKSKVKTILRLIRELKEHELKCCEKGE